MFPVVEEDPKDKHEQDLLDQGIDHEGTVKKVVN